MRAVGVVDHGGPEVLRVVELPDPRPGPGEVLIRVHAAAVNPADLAARSGVMATSQRRSGPPPYVVGMDAAGVLVEVGDEVDTDLAVGDHVMAIVMPNGRSGAYAEQLVVPVESVARAPKGSTHVEACTLPMNGLTARLALDTLGLRPGQTVAVTGAAGALGGYAVELAKADGLTVAADASEADDELVARLGADVVLRRGEGFAARVRERFPEGVDGAVDAAVLNAAITPAMRDGATVATVRGFGDPAERGVSFAPVRISAYARRGDLLDGLRELVERGRLTLRVAGTVPMDRAADAHRRMEAGGSRGRWVIEL